MCLQIRDQTLLSPTTKYTAIRLGDKVSDMADSAPRDGEDAGEAAKTRAWSCLTSSRDGMGG
jgi:hypothetical protein